MDTETLDQLELDFGAAFNEAVGAAAEPPVSEPTTPEPAAADPAPAEPADSLSVASPSPSGGAESPSSIPAEPEPSSVPEPAAAEPAPAPAPDAPVWAEAPTEPGEPTTAAPVEVPGLTEDQQKILAQYQEDFPEIYEAEALRQQVAMQQAFGAFAQQLSEYLGPILAQVGQQAIASHEQQLAAAHPDYREITPRVVEWVDQQPPFLRQTFEQVLREGTTQQVVDLLTHFKRVSGAAPAAPAAAPAPAPAQAAAAAALAPVRTQRAAPAPRQVDMDDFDGAFAEALKAVS